MLLALANLTFVAIAAAVTMPSHGGDGLACHCGELPDATFEILLTFGSLPAIVAGALLGGLADHLAASAPWARFAILGALAALVVAVLGTLSMWFVLIPLACVPTLVGVAILERWTRRPIAAPLPPAYRR